MPSLFYPGSPKKTYILPRNIAAIQAISDGQGHTRMGTILQLPEGTQVDVCGDGFNDRTVKVSCQSGFYFIFLEDVEAAVPVSARTQAAAG
ncbi:MAG: hypothetical protein JOZ48_15740 [Acidobacteriaceae bacterium]|nr:hypothetical protein [Acidobacteriaceae bacterium]